MNEILEYSFLGWSQFLIIASVSVVALLIANKFHLFDRHSWNTSIGYHMFFCVILSIVIITFLLINPIFHSIFLLVIFGFIYKNVFSYVRAIFNLYFSNIHMGDSIRVDGAEGVLTNINIGGMHISANSKKTYFPFNNWKGDKIVLLSEAGKVSFCLEVKDSESRTDEKSIYALEKKLFNFPYLANEKISVRSQNGSLVLKAMVSAGNIKESIKSNIQKAGFSINEINNK